MENYNYKTLKSLRQEQGLNQVEMAGKLNMSQSNYSKLENNQKKIIPIDLIESLAKALSVSQEKLSEILTGKKKEEGYDSKVKSLLEFMQDQINARDRMIENFINTAFHHASSKYEEGVPWEILQKVDIEYIEDVSGAKTKEDYESLEYPLVSYVTEENNQLAFEEILENMDIYSCFHFGIVKDEHYQKYWEVFSAKGQPKFDYKHHEDHLQITRIGIPGLEILQD